MENIHAGIDFKLPQQTEEHEKRLAEHEAQLRKWEEEEAQKRFERTGVPEKFFNESFDTFKCENEKQIFVYDTVRQFAREPKNLILILHGENGTGKSHLLSSILRETGGEYITSSMLCMKYDSALGYKAKMSREEIIEHYIKLKGVLVIDECCKYFLNKELEKFILLTVLCGRYENNKATALGTNTDKQPFIEFLGKAVFDRCTEVCKTLLFDWESRRKDRRE